VRKEIEEIIKVNILIEVNTFQFTLIIFLRKVKSTLVL
jgi:hypothetical protein